MNVKMVGGMIVLAVLAFTVNRVLFPVPAILPAQSIALPESPVEVVWSPPAVNAQMEEGSLRKEEIRKAQELQESNPNAYFGDPSLLVTQ